MIDESQEVPPSADLFLPQVSARERRSGPWGFWPTVGLSLVIAVAYVLVQAGLLMAALVIAAARTEALDVESYAQRLAHNGLFWSLAVLAGGPVMVGLTVLFAAAAHGFTVRDYLALRWPGRWSVIRWCLILLAFILVSDYLTYRVHDRLVPAFLETVYATAYFTPLLWFAFVVVAPVSEEVFFRGFLFKGIAHSRVGPAGAVILGSLLWAALHMQYDLYGIATVFAGGLLVGYARWRTGSLYVPIIMHMVQNAIATLEVALSLAKGSGPV